MYYSEITGWGKCLPKAVLTNDDLSTILDTDDNWITTRTGIKERRISSVGASELAFVAVQRALSCAGLTAKDIELLIVCNCSPDYQVPNMSAVILKKLGNINAGAMDINSACTGFVTGLITADAMMKTNSYKRVVVVGAECMSQIIPWLDRSISVLFGDGAAAVVLEKTTEKVGVISNKLTCISEAADTLKFDFSCKAPFDDSKRLSSCVFLGKEIFKSAVNGMYQISLDVLEMANLTAADIGLIIPHQANLRIVDSIRNKFKLSDSKVFVNLQVTANTSAASIPLALCDALEQGRVNPNDYLVLPAFGAGLTCASAVVKWGSRVSPINTSSVELPEQGHTALELVKALINC